MIEMIKALILSLVSRLFYGRDPLKIKELNLKEEQEKTLSYQCFGCEKKEYLTKKEPLSSKEITLFWERWGSIDNSLIPLRMNDGAYQVKRFCPTCRLRMKDHLTKDDFGYDFQKVRQFFK